MKNVFLSALAVSLFTFATPSAHARTEITFWHAMDGDLETALNALVASYNKSQDKVEVKPVFKGNYTETLNGAIAAYRGGKQPNLVQVFEVGTQTMMSSGAIVPVQDLMSQAGQKVDWGGFLPPVLSYYKDAQGKLMSMPFNSSSPIMYYNKDLMKKAGIKAPPKTWQELFTDSEKAVKSGAACGTVIGWQPWVLIENFSAIHDIPFASLDNGYGGLNAELKFNNPKVIELLSKLQELTKTKAFTYEGRRSDPAVHAFTMGNCVFAMDSSGDISTVKAQAKFSWAAAPMPYNEGTKPKNSIIGGATLWVFKGHSDEENKATADFLRFLGQTPAQEQWHKATGYLLITKAAYQQLKKEGYYKSNPEQEVAVLQLQRGGTPGPNSRGIRLGGFTQVREIMDEEMEKIWAGTSTPTDAMNSAVSRGNRVLQQFAKSAQ